MFYKMIRAIAAPLIKLFYPYEIINYPELDDEAYILMSNHKSAWDPLVISVFFPRTIHWMAKRELFESPVIGWIMKRVEAISVDRDRGDTKSTIQAMRILKKGEVLGIFPEGTRVKEADYSAAKSGTALLASRTGTTILPLYIEGEYRLFRKRRYIFRDPIPFEKKKLSEKQYDDLMQMMMKNIYEGERVIGTGTK